MASDAEPDHLVVVLGSNVCDCVDVIKDCGADIVVNPFWECGLAGSVRLGVERAEEAGASRGLALRREGQSECGHRRVGFALRHAEQGEPGLRVDAQLEGSDERVLGAGVVARPAQDLA